MKKQMWCVATLAAFAASAPAMAQVQAAIDTSLITQADAQALAQAAIAACREQDMSVTAQVADADGNLRVSLSADHASLAGIKSAPQKLASVLTFHATTRALQARVASDPAFAAQYGKDPRYHFAPGGLQLYRNGKFVAVLAVGGGRAIDESCALAAVNVLPWVKLAP